ncbi:hypothetical protein [Puniceicoccus vermicola]|uniref:Uncharacterized protein n=1 Tax=Puniceicoccus vermicola TaxID=388746 RepID=A0A7X1AW04_9BACT|nr:hypothetical protein [Puniceicoccus vermicola]MBC2600991.1 hypothetical protein [Puniceicoccus vermicola]MBC2600992.1 hypothetical protein [Puniceicoccus vermicola]MBC2601000.1 hypothetical protein [Puniceicoccus vermicola]
MSDSKHNPGKPEKLVSAANGYSPRPQKPSHNFGYAPTAQAGQAPRPPASLPSAVSKPSPQAKGKSS